MTTQVDAATVPMASRLPTADPLQEARSFAAPKLECDIVMKGGITSGVVYPRAVCEIARAYRFRSIGGTSAGAIAAALTAAAELGRARGRPGFPELAALPEWLGGRTSEGGSNLFSLFRPQPETAAIFRTVAALAGPSRGRMLRLTGAAVRNFPMAAFVGAVAGLGLFVVALTSVAGWATVLFALVGLMIAALGCATAMGIGLFRRFWRTVPANFYGLCTGMGDDSTDAPVALTPWLTALLDRLAGQSNGTPLTFGDLWQGDTPDPDGGIDLQFMTTNLTHGRPYRVPFEAGDLHFHPEEMRQLFPEYVVRWMEEHPRPASAASGGPTGSVEDKRLANGLCRMPAPADLPVVVGARLSLSFPLLISAVPLWAVDFTRRRAEDRVPERTWFSDGGICSNFPVHFFDAPLPGRPTFALNLRGFHPDYPRSDDEAKNSWIPNSNGDGQSEWWNRFDAKPGLTSLLGFFGAIKDAMQNWVDNGQLKIPGYRDRVVHVSLASDEGGLNLDMPPQVIARLGLRGQLAAGKLARRFSPDGDGTVLTWDNHRWVRYRSAMNVLERLLYRMRLRYAAEPTGQRGYADLVTRAEDEPPKSYAWSNVAQREHALDLTTDLMDLPFVDASELRSLANGAPRPDPELRIVPRV